MQLSDFSNQGYQNFEQVPLLELLFFDFYAEVLIPARSGPFSHNGLIPAPPPHPTNIRLERETGNEPKA